MKTKIILMILMAWALTMPIISQSGKNGNESCNSQIRDEIESLKKISEWLISNMQDCRPSKNFSAKECEKTMISYADFMRNMDFFYATFDNGQDCVPLSSKKYKKKLEEENQMGGK